MRASISAARPSVSSPICEPTASTWTARAITAARSVIGKEFGESYVPGAPRKYTVKAKNAQEAHEAIRPTDLARLPAMVARHLEPEQAKLYELIWKRTIASQMESASMERTTVDIAAKVGAAAISNCAPPVRS
jgi:DNA topoisomerase-1